MIGKIVWAAAMFMLVAPVAAEEGDGKVVVRPVASADLNSFGQPIVFPSGPGHVAVSIYEIAPGAALPVHKHPAPRLGYVLSGTLRVTNEQSGEIKTFRQGEVILEAVDQWHTGANPGKEPLELLVVDLQPKGAGNPSVLLR